LLLLLLLLLSPHLLLHLHLMLYLLLHLPQLLLPLLTKRSKATVVRTIKSRRKPAFYFGFPIFK
jgi:hypothetical protein